MHTALAHELPDRSRSQGRQRQLQQQARDGGLEVGQGIGQRAVKVDERRAQGVRHDPSWA